LWDQAQAGVLVEPPDYQIEQVVHKLIDAQTGQVSSVPEPKPRRTHLASRMAEAASAPPAKPTSPSWSHEQLAGQGPRRWSRANRDKVIVFVGHLYGIFHASELLVLSGVRVRELPPHLGSRDDILHRYGCLPDV